MVQAVENRSHVWCAATGEPEPGPAPGWSTVAVVIEATEPTPPAEHLLAGAEGREYTALVPPKLMPRLAGAQVWAIEVEVVGPNRIVVRGLVAD